MIVEDEKACDSLTQQEIDKTCCEAGLSATPRFIYHDIDYVNLKLAVGHYFFSDIVAEGKMLYDSGMFQLTEERALTPAEQLKVVQEDFDQWFQNSQQFFKKHRYSFSEGWMKQAAFDLHQAAESAYKTALIVFTGYIPDEHYLGLLSAHAAHIDNAFRTVFSSNDEFERKAFAALEYAYIGARYDKRYTIDERSVRYLAGRVEALIALTETRCHEKIATLQSAATD